MSSKLTVFVKLGGSFITDKKVTESLLGERIASAARQIREALDEAAKDNTDIALILGHGAGSFGHIHAVKYDAVKGIHPKLGWEGLYKIRESMAKMIPSGFEGVPQDIAGVAVFLASPEARYIIGQTIVVDGGTTSWMPFSDAFRHRADMTFGQGYVPRS